MPRQRRLVHVYRDTKGEWRWRMFTSGNNVANSGEGYSRRFDAKKAFLALEVGMPVELRLFHKSGDLLTTELIG